MSKEFLGTAHQVAYQAFHLQIRIIDQGRKTRFKWAEHHCGPPILRCILARSQFTTSATVSGNSSSSTVAARVVRNVKTVYVRVTDVCN